MCLARVGSGRYCLLYTYTRTLFSVFWDLSYALNKPIGRAIGLYGNQGNNESMNSPTGITTGSPKYTAEYFSKDAKSNATDTRTPRKTKRSYESLPSRDLGEDMSLPWYHEQMLPENVDSPAAENSTSIIHTELIIDRQTKRIEALPKRDHLKYIVQSDVATENEVRFSNFSYWHDRSISIDLETRKNLESVAATIDAEVKDRKERAVYLKDLIRDQEFGIQDTKRSNSILSKKVDALLRKYIEARKLLDDSKVSRKLWSDKCEQERRNTRKEIMRSCQAELRLHRDRANILARPQMESACIECCCEGKSCKDESNCCYKCYFRDEVYVEQIRFKTHTTHGCWKCKYRTPFVKPEWIKYTDDAFIMFRARTGFGKTAVMS